MPIVVTGASEHNLQRVDAEFADGLTVVTGVSGSGKTSLVFDTLYHEARRRFLDVFGQGAAEWRSLPAQVDAIDGLGPAVAVGQNLLNRNPSSTLASASGLHPFLRLLYARFGRRRCRRCGAPLGLLTDDEIVQRLVALSARGSLRVIAPLVEGVAGSHATLLRALGAEFGTGRLRVDGAPWRGAPLDPARPHRIQIELARASSPLPAARARGLLQTSSALGANGLLVSTPSGEERLPRAPVCPACGAWFGELAPVHFHTPCPHCQGAGCGACAHTGLHPEAAATDWGGLSLPGLLSQSVGQARRLAQTAEWLPAAARLRAEIERRLDALDRVGLGYLGLDRPAPTLSRGEAQRVRLAVALTSRLEDVLHVLDEPTVGQHPADVARLLPAFRGLAGPVVYVEHDRAAAAAADRAIDLGPGAGPQGGRVVFNGTPAGLWRADTPTGRFFSLRQRVAAPGLRPPPERFLTVRGASLRTLKGDDIPIPVGRLTVVTGVSGSGKSTLVEEVLVASLEAGKPVGCAVVDGPALRPVLVTQDPIGVNPRSNPATYTKLADAVRDAFAAATGLSPSHFSFNRNEGACPACQGMGAVEVRMRYLPAAWVPCIDCGGSRFSDEVLAARARAGGRELSIADLYAMPIAEAAVILLEPGFLAGARRAAAGRILQALRDVGLGYLALGQPSPTLSGGEAQRVKLARHLGMPALGGQLLVLDEPSTGLHPQDVAGLLVVLDRLARAGATVVVVEHHTDIMRAADWVIDLGPGAGEDGGRLVFAGPPDQLLACRASATAQALREEAALAPRASAARRSRRAPSIAIRGARANNLRGVDVDFPKRALTVVTGVSGSGKSSLVHAVLEAEAKRRYLESLSMYERQGVREGPEAPVDSVSGLGVAVTIGPPRRVYDRRATLGTATEISHHLAALLAAAGERNCPSCGAPMRRTAPLHRAAAWLCPSCGATAAAAEPRHFSPHTYAAACLKCHGIGTLQGPNPDKLIVRPDLPLCGGAMHSPGFFPKGYLCKPFNGGYDEVQALAERYSFDPCRTPWNRMAPEAQRAFLFGDPRPLPVTFRSRTGRVRTSTVQFRGFYGWIGDWDTGGTYTDTLPCPDCGGSRLRPEFLAVTLAGRNIDALSRMTLDELGAAMREVVLPPDQARLLGPSLETVRRRTHFLRRVGLGYAHLNRLTETLSAGEAQRARLAGLLGSRLTSLTVLVDEPTRGLHPAEVDALVSALADLRDEGNTVIAVEHDPQVMRAADIIVDLGPGAGAQGGRIVARGAPAEVARADTMTGAWLRGERRLDYVRPRREPRGWLTVRGARANNLRGGTVSLPLGTLTGVCGVSGSGKSTLMIDTLGRALAPAKHTTSVAREPIEPGAHDGIDGAPPRVILLDQSRAGLHSPASFLELDEPLRALYAAGEDARALGLDERSLARACAACHGSGVIAIDMGFLPDATTPCEVCRGTGCLPEAWEARLNGLALPEAYGMTLDQAFELFGAEDAIRRPLQAAREAGLGYLVLRQPGHALSGGEAQRLKMARELSRPAREETLYLLDEPTVGQHLEDVARLVGALRRLVDAGHTVYVVEHHAHLLAACDWLVELGPGGGPDGGLVVAAGTPEAVARGNTATAPYLRALLEAPR